MRIYAVVPLFVAGFMMSKAYATPNCCYDPPIGKEGYITKEYVDSKVAELNSKLDSIEARISKLKSELSNVSTIPANLMDRLNALESAISELGKTCPAECSGKLSSIEKDLAELKDKLEKREKSLEKEVEKSMRK